MNKVLPRASFVPTKKQLQIIKTTAERWGKTLFEPQTPNLSRVNELLTLGYANRRDRGVKDAQPPRVYAVYSPLAFFVAQGVIRGVLSKEKAAQVLNDYGVDPEPILKPLRRDTLAPLMRLEIPRYWARHATPTDRLWRSTIGPIINIAMRQIIGADINADDWRRDEYEKAAAREMVKKCNFDDLPEIGRFGFAKATISVVGTTNATGDLVRRWKDRYGIFNNELYGLTRPDFPRTPGYNDIGNFSRVVNHAKVNYTNHVYYTNPARDTIMSRTELIDPDNFCAYGPGSIIDAEVSAKIMGIKSLSQTWSFELLHEVSAVMTFSTSALVLVGHPTIRVNADNEMHCDTGPAVEWEDGASLYFVDGHPLGWVGRTAICEPEKLTPSDINMQANEETRRILIERVGWDNYLTQVGAKVLDSRENWVDNTVELLIEFERELLHAARLPTGAAARITDRRLVLACRSTGRKYFIAVPQEITSCEQGQIWLAGGAQTKELPALRHEIRVIGAS